MLAAALMVMSGIAGVAVGGASAAAGWWLVAVGAMALLALWLTRSRRVA
jgi:hypothetical protein